MTLASHLLPPASLADIAISSLTGQGQYGAVTQIARDYGLTRQQVYRLRDTGHQAIQDAFAPQQPATWQADLPKAHINRAIVALYTIAPNSIDDIVDLLPVLFNGRTRSHGYIHGVAPV